MKHIFIDEHFEDHSNSKTLGVDSTIVCEKNTNKDVFFFNGDFYLLEYYGCSSRVYGKPYELIETLLNANDEHRHKIHEIERSVCLDKQLKEHRLRGHELKRFTREINYIYSGFGQVYCITTMMNLFDVLDYNSYIEVKKNKAIEYLKEKELLNLVKNVEKLYLENLLFVSEKEIYKSVEHISKRLKTKEYETSK